MTIALAVLLSFLIPVGISHRDDLLGLVCSLLALGVIAFWFAAGL